MKISIITIALNAAETIEETVQSVLSQTYDDIEYIVIDGNSRDETMDILDRYRDRIDLIISEPDDGIYDAMNKGIKYSTGDVIGILNAEDTFTSRKVVEHAAKRLKEWNCDTLYGDLVYVKRENESKIVRKWISGKFQREAFLRGWMPPHPTFFVKREVYLKYGDFNTRLKISADYEFMLRVLFKENVSTVYLPETLVKMKAGGQSNISVKNRLRANLEDRLSWELNGLRPLAFTLWQKPFRKIGQFIFR